MASAVYNPIVPCVHPIPEDGMFPGRMIRIRGSTPPGASRFEINLQCGPNTSDPRDHIALHLNPRFTDNCVVLNQLTHKSWGIEQRVAGMPIKRGAAFEVLILCDSNYFKIAFNGVHFYEFLHWLHYQRITHLTVDGDVTVQFIGFEDARATVTQQSMQQPSNMANGRAAPHNNNTIANGRAATSNNTGRRGSVGAEFSKFAKDLWPFGKK